MSIWSRTNQSFVVKLRHPIACFGSIRCLKYSWIDFDGVKWFVNLEINFRYCVFVCRENVIIINGKLCRLFHFTFVPFWYLEWLVKLKIDSYCLRLEVNALNWALACFPILWWWCDVTIATWEQQSHRICIQNPRYIGWICAENETNPNTSKWEKIRPGSWKLMMSNLWYIHVTQSWCWCKRSTLVAYVAPLLLGLNEQTNTRQAHAYHTLIQRIKTTRKKNGCTLQKQCRDGKQWIADTVNVTPLTSL